jgi:LPS-assembly lipoprotein
MICVNAPRSSPSSTEALDGSDGRLIITLHAPKFMLRQQTLMHLRGMNSMKRTGSSMSWRKSHRSAALALAALLLAACGFHPLYANRRSSGLDEQLASVKVSPVSDRIGQMLVRSLRDGLNPAGLKVAQRYTLTITLTRSIYDLAIRKDGTASREAYTANAYFTLQDAPKNTIALTGLARANDSYDVGENPFTSTVANSDADRKAADSMSQQIQSQIVVYLRRQASAAPSS